MKKNSKEDICKQENSRIVNTLPEIKNKNYKIIARGLKDKLYNNWLLILMNNYFRETIILKKKNSSSADTEDFFRYANPKQTQPT